MRIDRKLSGDKTLTKISEKICQLISKCQVNSIMYTCGELETCFFGFWSFLHLNLHESIE